MEIDSEILKVKEEKLKVTSEELENKIEESEKLQAKLKEVASSYEITKKNLKEE